MIEHFNKANMTAIVYYSPTSISYIYAPLSNCAIRKRAMDYLTTLPVELIYKILDNVPTFDIFLSLFLVNKRLRSVATAYECFQPNFTSVVTKINKTQFDFICTQLIRLSSQIISLTLFDKNDPLTPTKNAFFFLRISYMNGKFSNLHSLNLTYIDYDTWYLFKARLPLTIKKLSIHLVYNGGPNSAFFTSETLCEFLFFSPLLEYLSIKMSNYSENLVTLRRRNPPMFSSIQYFHLDGITIDISSLFLLVPNLHTLEVNFHNSRNIIGIVHNQPQHLQRLKLEFYAITWTLTATLLSSFPQLGYLTVIANDLDSDMADGNAWAELLREVKHFDCKLQFCWNAFTEQSINLDSFRTKFWLEEKQWFVHYEQKVDTDYSILYTNSSSVIDCVSNDIIGVLVSESSKLYPTSLPTSHCLTINYQYVKYALLHRYTQNKQRNISYINVRLPLTFKDISTYLDLSRIVTCYPSNEWIAKSPIEMIEFLQTLPNLRALSVSGPILNYLIQHQWPNIIHLRIENESDDNPNTINLNLMDTLCHSFSRLERIDIHLSCIEDRLQT